MLSLLVVPMLLMVGATYAKMMIDMSLERISFVSEATTVVQQVPMQMNAMLELIRFTTLNLQSYGIFVHRLLQI
jgi:ATP-binding cassette, subfamily B (MDR/TAP), member 1